MMILENCLFNQPHVTSPRVTSPRAAKHTHHHQASHYHAQQISIYGDVIPVNAEAILRAGLAIAGMSESSDHIYMLHGMKNFALPFAQAWVGNTYTYGITCTTVCM